MINALGLASFTQVGSTWDNSRLVKYMVNVTSTAANMESNLYAASNWVADDVYYLIVKRSSAGIISFQLLISRGNLLLSSSSTAAFTFTNTSGVFVDMYTESSWQWEGGVAFRIGSDSANSTLFDLLYPW